MSTIPSASDAQLYTQRASPHHGSGKSRMTSTISDEASNGTISSTDATALTNALSAIDTGLSSDGTASTASATGTDSTSTAQSRLDPSSVKDRINGLIADQVSSGSLTSDQASELKNLFSSHGRSTQSSDAASAASSGSASSTDPSTDPSTSSPTSSSTSDLLSTFIQQLQAAQSSATGYVAGGTSGSGGSYQASALLFDFNS